MGKNHASQYANFGSLLYIGVILTITARFLICPIKLKVAPKSASVKRVMKKQINSSGIKGSIYERI